MPGTAGAEPQRRPRCQSTLGLPDPPRSRLWGMGRMVSSANADLYTTSAYLHLGSQQSRFALPTQGTVLMQTPLVFLRDATETQTAAPGPPASRLQKTTGYPSPQLEVYACEVLGAPLSPSPAFPSHFEWHLWEGEASEGCTMPFMAWPSRWWAIMTCKDTGNPLR